MQGVLTSGDLAPGTLFSIDETAVSHRHVVLGPSIKKPMIQVVLECFPGASPDELTILNPESRRVLLRLPLGSVCSGNKFAQWI